ncbi:MAG: molybdopterin molybdotransferase MoeA [Neisseriaceae bacterium]|nr:molybdopterin molybdotransferase MoeA [Neisseriaceae bacterium]
MIDFYDALNELQTIPYQAPATETLPLRQAANRILATDVHAKFPSPLFDNSAMDGYALCAPANEAGPFTIVERIAAGDSAAHVHLAAGEAVRIFTGAPVPKGTTAVVPQEETLVDGSLLSLTAPVTPAQHIRFAAEETRVGDLLVPAGTPLSTANLGLIASQGYPELTVFKPLSIVVFSSGNEVINPEQPLGDGQIYDANRFQLLAWLSALGAHVTDGGILPDQQLATEAAFTEAAANHDIIVTSGGVSVGEEDHLKNAIMKAGTLIEHKVLIKPGKPFSWGTVGAAKVFMLPGNPVATFATSQLLLQPALKRLMGIHPRFWQLTQVYATAAFDQPKKIKRREFLRAVLTTQEGHSRISLLPHQGSAMLSACTQANCLVEVPPQTAVVAGDALRAYLLLI